jgi:NADH dehydrogenase (ubiquinone) 1 alpha/beta subcomplex 1
MSFIHLAARNFARPRIVLAIPRTPNFIPWRAGFSAAAGLTKEAIETRVLDVLKGFEKVNPSKV